MSKVNVLVFPAGEINSVELHDALASCVNINLFGASSVDRHGGYIFENYISGLPLISSSVFFEKFNDLLTEKQIDVIFPTHDTIAMFFARNTDKINAKVIVADSETSEICRDKEKTYNCFKSSDFTPEVFGSISTFPVFIKPKEGQGSIGAKIIRDANDIPQGIEWSDYVICEYLSGEEYTVDCLTDKDGKLRFLSPRSRSRLLAGVSVAGQTEELTPEILNIAETINNRLSFLGLWWFQIKKNSIGKWKLLEISTRVAGTMCLTRAKGVNLPLLSVYTALGYDISIEANSYDVKLDRTLISRYKISHVYNTVYFDFDDTLTLRGKINLKAIWFLYQCRNLGKKVILLTRHENDIFETLEQFAISKKLFANIISLKSFQNKVDFINPENAIFIDNSFQERHNVAQKCKIPVFDVDGIEVLLDWRY